LKLTARSHQRGQASVLMAFAIPVLMAMASLSIDVGYWRYQQRLQQTAADSAARAGAVALGNSASQAAIVAAARADAAANGFADGSSATVTVNTPPSSGDYAGNPGAVEVIVAKAQPVHFGTFFGQSDTVSARAVAMPSTANRNCIYALDPAGAGALTLAGGTVSMPACGMISNGGLTFDAGSVNAASIGYAGGSASVNATSFSLASPQPAVAAADPCPTISGCAYLTSTPPVSGTCASQTTFNSAGTVTLSPGNYCSQVLVEGGGPVVFSPGVYTFQDGFVNNDDPSLSGTGVTFYVPAGSFNAGLDPTVNLSAPTTGPTQGVLLYQPAGNGKPLNISSCTSQPAGGWAGMIYAPASQVTVDAVLSAWLLIVGYDVTLDATSAVNVPSASFPGLVGPAVLAE
jgi:Flp pilus assembly protein TadG